MVQTPAVQLDADVLKFAETIQELLNNPEIMQLTGDQLATLYMGALQDLHPKSFGSDPDSSPWAPLHALVMVAIVAARSPDPSAPLQ